MTGQLTVLLVASIGFCPLAGIAGLATVQLCCKVTQKGQFKDMAQLIKLLANPVLLISHFVAHCAPTAQPEAIFSFHNELLVASAP